MGERYFTFEIADFHSDNFAYVGKRTTGSKAGSFAILPPGWKGKLPSDVSDSFESPTTYVLIFGRTLVDGPSDVLAVNKLQDQYHLTPLALWGRPNVKVPEGRDVFKPYRDIFKPDDGKEDPLADWRTINRAWNENPLPEDRDRDLIELFSEIGVGPGFSAESLDDLPEPIKRGLARAAKTTRPMIDKIMVTGAYKSKIVNGWNYPPKSFGRAGLSGDFVTRAALQSLGGIIANDPEEGVYLNTFVDIEGKALAGGSDYTIRFNGDNLPPTNEFFSLTLYGPDSNFVANELKRYSFGDRSKGLVKDKDGSFTIYVQPNKPQEKEKIANWLPSPSKGNFYLVLRTYGPKQPIIEQVWEPPAVFPVK